LQEWLQWSANLVTWMTMVQEIARLNPTMNTEQFRYLLQKPQQNIQPWIWSAHPYCSAYVNMASYPLWDGKMSISFWAE